MKTEPGKYRLQDGNFRGFNTVAEYYSTANPGRQGASDRGNPTCQFQVNGQAQMAQHRKIVNFWAFVLEVDTYSKQHPGRRYV
jgi:hypothetical protein